jgi:hypothetical protein
MNNLIEIAQILDGFYYDCLTRAESKIVNILVENNILELVDDDGLGEIVRFIEKKE